MTNKTKGILCIIASAFGFALMALCVRLPDDYGLPVPPVQKSFFRNLIAFIIAAFVFCRTKHTGHMRVRPALWWRSIFGTLGIFCNFYALSHIPIAEGQTLNKVAPFFTVLLSWLVLKEKVSFKQMAALVLAFFGVLLVIKPGFAGDATWPLLAGLMGGLGAGAAYMCVRKLGLEGVEPTFIVLFFSGFSCLASVPFMAWSFGPMTLAQVLILLGAGIGAAIGQFGVTEAYRFAAPREISVFDYSNILFTAVFGFAFFGQIPDVLSICGFLIIFSAALLAWRH